MIPVVRMMSMAMMMMGTISVDDDGVEVGSANTRDDHDDHDYG